MLVKQIHVAWQADNGIASLLLLDMTGAFDRVMPVRLHHNLRKRHIPQWLVYFISSFPSDRSTSLCFPGFSSPPFFSEQGIPQGSLLSPILFLFYNADLIDACNSPDISATGIGFVDDANVLACGKCIKETCSVLKEIHSRCLTWGDMHGASFAPHKYVLFHFPTKKRKDLSSSSQPSSTSTQLISLSEATRPSQNDEDNFRRPPFL
jgi:hypothetical protein